MARALGGHLGNVIEIFASEFPSKRCKRPSKLHTRLHNSHNACTMLPPPRILPMSPSFSLECPVLPFRSATGCRRKFLVECDEAEPTSTGKHAQRRTTPCILGFLGVRI
eukprot:285866-Prorocentrum_minimum.AAC.1